MNKKLLLGGGIAVLVLSVGIAWLGATASVGVTAVAPSIIGVNTPTQVTATAQIDDSRLIQTSVNLLRLDAQGNTVANLGAMYDDGTNGDAVVGDRIFSRTIRQIGGARV